MAFLMSVYSTKLIFDVLLELNPSHHIMTVASLENITGLLVSQANPLITIEFYSDVKCSFVVVTPLDLLVKTKSNVNRLLSKATHAKTPISVTTSEE